MKKILAAVTALVMLLSFFAAAEEAQDVSFVLRNVTLTVNGSEFPLEPSFEYAVSGQDKVGIRIVSHGTAYLETVFLFAEDAMRVFFPGYDGNGLEVRYEDGAGITVPVGAVMLLRDPAIQRETQERMISAAIRVIKERRGIDLSGLVNGTGANLYLGYDTEDVDAVLEAILSETQDLFDPEGELDEETRGAMLSSMGVRLVGSLQAQSSGDAMQVQHNVSVTYEDESFDFAMQTVRYADGSADMQFSLTVPSELGYLQATGSLLPGGQEGTLSMSYRDGSEAGLTFGLTCDFELGPTGIRFDKEPSAYANVLSGDPAEYRDAVNALQQDAMKLCMEPSVLALVQFFSGTELPGGMTEPEPEPQPLPEPEPQPGPEEAGGYFTQLPAGLSAKNEQMLSDVFGTAELVDDATGARVAYVSVTKEDFVYSGMLGESGAAAPGADWFVRADVFNGTFGHVNAFSRSLTVDIYLYRDLTTDEIFTILNGIKLPD